MVGGPLQGARYLEVGWEDLKKAAKAYKSDQRFCQFAKRVMSERALGSGTQSSESSNVHSQSWKQLARSQLKDFARWLWARSKVRIGLTICIATIIIVLLSRPLFYTVLAKSLAMSARVFLRRSLGFLAQLVDALLYEAANSLEASLITPPPPGMQTMPNTQYDLAAPTRSLHDLIMHGLFTLLGYLIGNRLPHAASPDRNARPTRLRVV